MTDTYKRKIAVVGAGAIGSVVGGLLARAGQDVTLVGRKEHVDAIRQGGLRIEGALGTFTVPVRVAETLDFRPDLVLLSVKTQDVATACEHMKLNAIDVPIITMQNGVRSDDIVASFFPKGNILSAIVMFNGQYLKAGQATYGGGGPLVIGEAFAENGARVQEIAELFRRAIPTEIVQNIRAAHWTKLLQNNLGNGLEAITGLPIVEVMQETRARKIGLLSLKESYQIIKERGYRPGPLPGLMAPVLLLARAPLSVGMWMLSKSRGSVKSVVGSTVQSLRRGKPTEIEYLNGEIVRLGREIGVQTPLNLTVVEMVKEVEQSGRFFPLEELVRRFSMTRASL